MAKRKDTEAEGQDGGAVKPSETTAMISASTLKALLTQDDKYKGEIDGLTGELREAIGNAVEKKHLDKDAYALVKKFRRWRKSKGPEFAARKLEMFLAYLDLSGEQKLLDAVGKLGIDEPVKEAEETEGDDGRVARPKFGESRVPA